MEPCCVCGSHKVVHRADYLEGTLLESSDDCPDCGYGYEYDYGHTREVIGRWETDWSYDMVVGEDRKRDNARTVALVVRRHELGLIPDAQKGFAAALAADPSDFTTAKVYADWLDEHGPDAPTTKWAAYRLRDYDDPVGFPPLDGVINRAAGVIAAVAIKRFEVAMAPMEWLMGDS